MCTVFRDRIDLIGSASILSDRQSSDYNSRDQSTRKRSASLLPYLRSSLFCALLVDV